MVSIGGALGGLFVGIIALVIFVSFYELPVTLAALGLFSLFLFYRESWRTDVAWAGVCILVLAPVQP